MYKRKAETYLTTVLRLISKLYRILTYATLITEQIQRSFDEIER